KNALASCYRLGVQNLMTIVCDNINTTLNIWVGMVKYVATGTKHIVASENITLAVSQQLTVLTVIIVPT
ncbi:MAG: hypothetical protein M0Z55_05620, partial [Peptococcaceae bacterium]|nr:hypothetical protein [Peptococcaceae bacterium]